MPTPPITAETLARTAGELLGSRLSADEADAIAPILNALAEEMRAMRQMDVSEAEPAMLYEARP